MKLTISGQRKIQTWNTLRNVSRVALEDIEFSPEDFTGGLYIDLSPKDLNVVMSILALYSALVAENEGFTKSLPSIVAKLEKATA